MEQSITLRNADLGDLRTRMEVLHTQKVDAVVPAGQMCVNGEGNLVVEGLGGRPGIVGVAEMTRTFERQLADKLNIPLKYADRMREDAPGLYARNVNTWFEKDTDRKFLIRSYKNGHLVARALLGSTYRIMDNIEVLYNVMETLSDLGRSDTVQIVKSDVSDARLYLKLKDPNLLADGGPIIEQYAERYGRAHTKPDELDRFVECGIIIRNSETGQGAFSVGPRGEIRVCVNGLVVTEDFIRAVHVGAKLDDGIIEWSDRTRKANRELVAAQLYDAMTKFLSTDYFDKHMVKLNRAGGYQIEQPLETISLLANDFGWTEKQREKIFMEYAAVGDHSAFGLSQAVTRYAQVEPNADTANDMEGSVFDVLKNAPVYDQYEIVDE